ncbi:glycine dehydrogenase (aminomethyl-transferring) [bacterium]|nr:glycine dehydrogenase (aminomethyl-transferring) [bacterium]|tara:strand:- start:14832 stop:17645 length:2814 start_codon:yes stop_codon:yes gene_type:complete
MGKFYNRHVDTVTVSDRLEALGVSTLDELMDQAIPASIRLTQPISIPSAMTEPEVLTHIADLANQNQPFRSLIGQGYYDCYTPSVIQRCILENPAWYTAYTPYQPEISQGRLEFLFYFQTMVSDLSGLPIANASLLDEATAAVEALLVLWRHGGASDRSVFLVESTVFPQTLAVLKGRAKAVGITIVLVDTLAETQPYLSKAFGMLIQSPNRWGTILNLTEWQSLLSQHTIPWVMATDCMALALMRTPGEWGADLAIGSTQRFGVPMGYGGPHAAFIAAADSYKRQLPGRMIGLSKDRLGNPAYRMALQTREQHIRREKATSNICTAQALLAIMATAYGLYHGPSGLKAIAQRIHKQAAFVHQGCVAMGLSLESDLFFDTVTLTVSDEQQAAIRFEMEKRRINLGYDTDAKRVIIAMDETVTDSVRDTVLTGIAIALGNPMPVASATLTCIGEMRSRPYLTQPVFHRYQTETEMMRYIRQLESKDVSLVHSMIPLGSCTMKLNAATALMPVSWPLFGRVHPMAPLNQVQGYQSMIKALSTDLAHLTGMAGVSVQPNSGAQGELAGLLVIKAYFESQGDAQRRVVLIPQSAHGTNPASAVLAGLEIVSVPCIAHGSIDEGKIQESIDQIGDRLFGLMITYPSTYGVFESNIQTICQLIHDAGGQVYLDGANLNAQLGLTTPRIAGADVCHLNLHKTFSIPHGGGGPGVGPIAVAKHLVPYLPGNEAGIAPIAAAQWGSASILLIAYAYNRLLGIEGLTESTKVAILNANYIAKRLSDHYPLLYTNQAGRVAHELIIDCRPFKKTAGITVDDIAKRLMDYGFHAPTMSWPVPGTLMIEPTESESLPALDQFCAAMIAIRSEINAIETGQADALDNVLKQAPHTAAELMGDHWHHAYTRQQASACQSAIPRATVSRVDQAYGDRNLVCACAPVMEPVHES